LGSWYYEVFNDFLGEHVGVGRIVELFWAFVSEPEDIEADFVAVEKPPSPILYPVWGYLITRSWTG